MNTRNADIAARPFQNIPFLILFVEGVLGYCLFITQHTQLTAYISDQLSVLLKNTSVMTGTQSNSLTVRVLMQLDH